MISTQIYSEFLKHTGLSDSIYKAVFHRIEDVIQKINKVSIESFFYRLEEDSVSLAFTPGSSLHIPLYIVDLMKNLFGRFYSLPYKSLVEISLKYHDQAYLITQQNNVLNTPEEVSFLERGGAFQFFTATTQERTFSELFDKLFNFSEFKEESTALFSPLQKLFSIASSKASLDVQDSTESGKVSYEIVIEDLTTRKEDLLNTLNTLREEYTKYQEKKEGVVHYVKFKDKYQAEYMSLKDEVSVLNEEKQEFSRKIQELSDVIISIENELSVLAEEEEKGEVEFYVTKKELLLQKSISLQNGLDQINSILQTNILRIKELDNLFKEVQTISPEDISQIDTQMTLIEKKQDSLLQAVAEIELNLQDAKEKHSKVATDLVHSSYTEEHVAKIEESSIIEYLRKPDLPISLTVVKRYLKQYFLYLCSTYSETTFSGVSDPINYVGWYVLNKHFGLSPKIIFSKQVIPSYDNTILVEE